MFELRDPSNKTRILITLIGQITSDLRQLKKERNS